MAIKIVEWSTGRKRAFHRGEVDAAWYVAETPSIVTTARPYTAHATRSPVDCAATTSTTNTGTAATAA
jgi:hypothetical protein